MLFHRRGIGCFQVCGKVQASSGHQLDEKHAIRGNESQALAQCPKSQSFARAQTNTPMDPRADMHPNRIWEPDRLTERTAAAVRMLNLLFLVSLAAGNCSRTTPKAAGENWIWPPLFRTSSPPNICISSNASLMPYANWMLDRKKRLKFCRIERFLAIRFRFTDQPSFRPSGCG